MPRLRLPPEIPTRSPSAGAFTSKAGDRIHKASREQLLESAVCFNLREMCLKDKALVKHFKPKALAEMFAEN